VFPATGCRSGIGRSIRTGIGGIDTVVEIRKKLDEFVLEKAAESGNNPLRESRFGLSRDGSYVNSWQMNYERIGFYATTYMLRDIGGDSVVQVTVPATETGVSPSAQEQQPFGWSGKINEYVAELAVWWAFELLEEKEARAFMGEHRPSVIFRFFEDGRFCELVARFNGQFWVAESFS
jgi:hypothetical protein